MRTLRVLGVILLAIALLTLFGCVIATTGPEECVWLDVNVVGGPPEHQCIPVADLDKYPRT